MDPLANVLNMGGFKGPQKKLAQSQPHTPGIQALMGERDDMPEPPKGLGRVSQAAGYRS